MEAIRTKIEATMPLVAEAVTLSAVSRAPSIDSEYNYLMGESGSAPLVPREGDRSGDTDGRIRLQKPEETYLENALISPANIHVGANFVYFGSLVFLMACTTYSYFNKRWIRHDVWELSDEHVVGPYLEQAELGGEKLIVPVFISGRPYTLRPANEPNKGVKSLDKSFPAHNMFARAPLDTAARETITTALAELGQGRST